MNGLSSLTLDHLLGREQKVINGIDVTIVTFNSFGQYQFSIIRKPFATLGGHGEFFALKTLQFAGFQYLISRKLASNNVVCKNVGQFGFVTNDTVNVRLAGCQSIVGRSKDCAHMAITTTMDRRETNE